MSYSLRPKNALRVPERFREANEETEDPPDPLHPTTPGLPPLQRPDQSPNAHREQSDRSQMQAKHYDEVARLRDQAESELAEIRRIAAGREQVPRASWQGPNDARTQRIYHIWRTHRNMNAQMANSLPRDMMHDVPKPQTREQYIEELNREGRQHPGLKANQPYVVEARRALDAAKAHKGLRASGSSSEKQEDSDTDTITPAYIPHASHAITTALCLLQLEPRHIATPQSQPHKLLPSLAHRMAPADTHTRTPPPYLRPLPRPSPSLSSSPSLPPSPPLQLQTRGEIRDGPCNKRIKLVAGSFTSPPLPPQPQPPRTINRNRLVSLAPMSLLPMGQMQQVQRVQELSTSMATTTTPVTGYTNTNTDTNTPENGHHANGYTLDLEEDVGQSPVTATATATAGTPGNDSKNDSDSDDDAEEEEKEEDDDETDTDSS